jgi:hypothetical protein
MRRLLLAFAPFFLCCAQTYQILQVVAPVAPQNRLGVSFTKDITPAHRSLVTSENNWSVYKYSKGSADPVPVKATDALLASPDSVELKVQVTPGEEVTRWVAVMNLFNFPSGSSADRSQPQPAEGEFSPAGTRREANIYLSGALAAAQKSKPQYAIDSSIAAFYDLGRAGAMGLESTVAANQGPEIDPDSIRAFLSYRKFVPVFRAVRDQAGTYKENTGAGLLFSVQSIGGEFNRGATDPKKLAEKPQVSNLMYASPQAVFAAPRWGVSERVRWELELLSGIELGRRLETLPNQSDKSGITRLLFGSDLYLYTLSASTGRKLMVTGQYRVRLPRTNEPYGFKDGNGAFQLAFDRRARHYVGLDTEYLVTPGLALSIKYKWGVLPPLFPRITHQVSVGLALLIRQNGAY